MRAPTAYELYFGRLGPHSPQRPELEDAFFSELWVRHGTSKATAHHRLDDLNQLIEPLLPPDRPLDVLDAAVSSGISTLEWTQSLAAAGIDHRMLAGDAVVDAYLLSFGQRLRALVDRTGFLMQLEIGGRGFSARPPHCLGRLRFLPAVLLVRSALRLFEPEGETGSSRRRQSSRGPRRRWGITCHALELVTPSLLEQPGAEVIEDDILCGGDLGRRFHVVRAANILNRGYFDAPTLRRMVMNLRERLLPSALLAVCRTMPDGQNRATVFRLAEHGRLSIVSRLNGGSEIEDLVLESNAPGTRTARYAP